MYLYGVLSSTAVLVVSGVLAVVVIAAHQVRLSLKAAGGGQERRRQIWRMIGVLGFGGLLLTYPTSGDVLAPAHSAFVFLVSLPVVCLSLIQMVRYSGNEHDQNTTR